MRNFMPAMGFAAGAAALLLAFGSPARADVLQTYDLAWSGASFHNSAAATGVITLDLTSLPNPTNPSSSETNIFSSITALSVTVTGASLGDGTFSLSDLALDIDSAIWDTNGSTLDMTRQLVGQTVANTCHSGTTTWGTLGGCSGDFNLFFDSPGPAGVDNFALAADGGDGDAMALTSFAPVAAVPEPASLALFGTALAGLLLVGRRKRKRA